MSTEYLPHRNLTYAAISGQNSGTQFRDKIYCKCYNEYLSATDNLLHEQSLFLGALRSSASQEISSIL